MPAIPVIPSIIRNESNAYVTSEDEEMIRIINCDLLLDLLESFSSLGPELYC